MRSRKWWSNLRSGKWKGKEILNKVQRDAIQNYLKGKQQQQIVNDNHCINYFLCCWDRAPGKGNRRREGMVLAHSLRDTVSPGGRGIAAAGAQGSITSTVTSKK